MMRVICPHAGCPYSGGGTPLCRQAWSGMHEARPRYDDCPMKNVQKSGAINDDYARGYKDGERSGIERAAKVAEAHSDYLKRTGQFLQENPVDRTVEKIRSLLT